MSGAPTAAYYVEPVALPEFPATPAQTALWHKLQAAPADPTLNVAARWRIEGVVDLPLLEQAWRLLVARHEILRTRFLPRGDALVQQVLPGAGFTIRHVDLRHLPEAERDAAAERLGREEAAAPFAELEPPLLRITVLQRAERRADMLLTTHHLAGDCWSNLVLARELATTCQALHAGRDAALGELPLQFGDYAAWRESWFAEGGAEPDQAYWTHRLAGLGPFSVPSDRPAPAQPTRRGDIVGEMVPDAIMQSVLATAREHGATFFAFGLAAFTALLHRWARQDDILVTTQVAGREDVELEGVVGPFINTIALRSDCAGDPRFADLLDATLGTVGEALQHAALPFEMLPRTEAPRRDGRRATLEGVNFQVLNSALLKDSDAGAFALKGFPSLSPGAKRDLDLYLVERSVGWRVQCEYDPDLFDRDTVAWLLQRYLAILGAASRGVSQRLSDLPFEPRAGVAPAVAAPSPMVAATSEAPTLVPEIARGNPGDGAALLDLWCAVLKRDAVPQDANFFTLGGDSLRAAQLLARAEARFGRRIGLAQLFRAPTPAGMAALFGITLPDAVPALPPLVEADDDTAWQIVRLREQGTGTPIIGVNNIGILHRLSELPGIDHPITTLRLFEPGRPHPIAGLDMGTIAARYLDLLRIAHPHGPYILFGECVHGVLAYEMARQLRAAGETVSMLVAVNMWHPTYGERLNAVQRWSVRLASLRLNFAEFLAGRQSFRTLLGHYSLPHRLGIFRAAKRLGLISEIPARTGAPEQEDFLLALMRARDGYAAQPSDGPMLLMTTPDQPYGHGFQPSLGWDGTAGGPVAIHRVRHVSAAPGEQEELPTVETVFATVLAATP
ncbi:condensation domain-containing protein [Plastoroseomonas arctica]|uniref:Carrier domain-containing protein n=1 Tax=Plastoroseomonas arctica TaxID=1509237 RepID=A0AAF1K6A9_9PROT|nr:condensation domain-containing protein [Plastoroseomonas arctica]MBR0657129.1 hypothetical protein [Plastoroseomonas arctica]